MPQQTWQNLKLTDISFCRSFSVIFKCYLVEKGEFHASLMETLRNLSSYENTRWLKVLQLHRTARESPGKASQTFPSNKMIDGKPILFSDWIKKPLRGDFHQKSTRNLQLRRDFFFLVKKLKTARKTSQMQQTMRFWAPRCVAFCFKFVFDSKSSIFFAFFNGTYRAVGEFLEQGKSQTWPNKKEASPESPVQETSKAPIWNM